MILITVAVIFRFLLFSVIVLGSGDGLAYGVCCLMASVLVEKKSMQRGTYQAQVIMHSSQVVHDHALIWPLLSTPGAEGTATSLT